MDNFIVLIKQAFAWIKNIATRIIRGIMSFARDIVGWFKGLRLNPSQHTPFIGNADSPEFKAMLKNAPVKNVGIYDNNVQIFNGVYDSESNEIVYSELLGADTMDKRTKEIIGNEPLVVLN